MIGMQIGFTPADLTEIQAWFIQFPEQVGNLMKKKVRPYASKRVEERLKKAPGPAFYPIVWTEGRSGGRAPNTQWGYYSLQKAAFFATEGFGKGIPSGRTNELIHAWQVRGNYSKGFSGITITNTDPKAPFVIGEFQQEFHANTGWIYAPDELLQIEQETLDYFDQEFQMLLNTFGKAEAK